jgi:hypothetical protein
MSGGRASLFKHRPVPDLAKWPLQPRPSIRFIRRTRLLSARRGGRRGRRASPNNCAAQVCRWVEPMSVRHQAPLLRPRLQQIP